MFIEIKEKKVQVCEISKNSEPLIIRVENAQKQGNQLIVDVGIFAKEDYINNANPKRGNTIEIPNRFLFENVDTDANLVIATSKIVAFLEAKGFVKTTDFEVFQMLGWEADQTMFPARISIANRILIKYFAERILFYQQNNFPHFEHDNYHVLYVHEIDPADRPLIEDNPEILIEENISKTIINYTEKLTKNGTESATNSN